MNKVVGIVVVAILLFLSGIIFYSKKSTSPGISKTQDALPLETSETPTPPITNMKASFAIFTNGTFRVFTAPMYHNLSQEVYIDASNPNIVRVEKADITWDDFFSTLPFKVTHECLTTGTGETFCTGSNGELKFYINGKKTVNALDQIINDRDKLLVTFGNESETAIQKQFEQMPN